MTTRTRIQTLPSRARLAKNLRTIRTGRGLSQERLGELAGMHRTYVSQVERMQSNVTLDNLDRLAHVLDVDVLELLALPSTNR